VGIKKSIPPIDALEKVTGRAKYCFDMKLQGMLYGKVKRSPHPHARITGIDTSKAESHAGVWCVVTAKDYPQAYYGLGLSDQPLFAQDVVRYVGEPVAAVAAESERAAEEALHLIEVGYEELPAYLDPEEAISPGAQPIHPNYSRYKREYVTSDLDLGLPNVCNVYQVKKGDVERGFLEADLVVESRFTTAMIAQCPLEPHVAIADVDLEGNITIWTNTQTPYRVKHQLCQMLRIPRHKVRIIVPPHVGGGFGNRVNMKAEGIAAALALKAKRPVKVAFTREEVFTSTTVRHPYIVYIKDGVRKDGRIIARYIKVILDGGAYADVGYLVTSAGSWGATAAYDIPNFHLLAIRAYTNHAVGGAYRGFGASQLQFAVESQMDIVAEKLGIDPVELRLRNLLDRGEENVEGKRLLTTGAKTCLLRAAELIGWGKPFEKVKGGLRRGRGIALGARQFVRTASSAVVRVLDDETIEVWSSATDLGQGARTIIAQIAAEEFKAPLSSVKVRTVDTDVTPFETGQAGSSTTFKVGQAVRLACLDAKKQLFDIAAKRLDACVEDLDMENGKIFVKYEPERSIRVSELFTYIPVMRAGPFSEYGEIIGRATFTPKGEDYTAKEAVSYSAQAVEVEVDVSTGSVRILKLVNVVDPGTPINPLLVEAQAEGGMCMGIGAALLEELKLDKQGRIVNPDFTDYKIPTALDVPTLGDVIVEVIETPYEQGPYGAKGIGEVVTMPTAAAIAHAIFDAVGVRLTHIPMTPQRIYEALAKEGGAHRVLKEYEDGLGGEV
jgi:CO/xanthine dehydrogenase Mo-binding subunit